MNFKIPYLPKRKKQRQQLMIIGAGLIILLTFGFVMQGSIYAGGWETKAIIIGLRADDRLINPSDPTAEFGSRGANQWNLDPDEQGSITRMFNFFPYELDNAKIGMPDIIVTSATPVHSDWQGQVTSNNQPVETYEVEMADGNVRLYDLHLFKFSVTIKTDADKGTSPIPYSETTFDPDFREFDGAAYVEFMIDPWQYRLALPDNPDSAVVDYFAGIMSAKITNIEEGLVTGTASPDTEWKATPHYSEGSAVNMFTDFDGNSYSATGFPQSGSPDPSIRSSAVLEFGATLRSGAKLLYGLPLIVVDIDVANVYVKYDVQVQVMTMHEFTIFSSPDPFGGGEKIPEEGGSNRTDIWDALGVFWSNMAGSFLDMFQNPLSWLMVFVLLVMGLIVVIMILRKRKQIILG